MQLICLNFEQLHEHLFPLFELDKKWKHPKSKKNISELMSKLPLSSITAIKVM